MSARALQLQFGAGRQQAGTASRHEAGALPEAWEAIWGVPAEPSPLDLRRIQHECAALGGQIKLIDRRVLFGALVGSQELRETPVHRWFTYKEGYSPQLLGSVITTLGREGPLRVADVFGGVATTALSGLEHEQVVEVRSLEYSPWAHFAGQAKLSWPELSAERLRALLPAALKYPFDSSLPFPRLSSFENPRIFHGRTVSSLLSARAHLQTLSGTEPHECDFFLLGLGAVIEDLSKAMKDGRALRIKGERRRRRSSLVEDDPPTGSSRVRHFLKRQWMAMIDDLDALDDARERAQATRAVHMAGDARDLAAARMPDGTTAFPDGWADLACFSPPYLNCVDYTELYKLELWLMDHIVSQDAFRATRLGTLRSHPSVQFPPRDSFKDVTDDRVVKLITELSEWLSEHSARRDVGPVVQAYFEDMYEVWQGQHALLAEDGVAVCVVANSTFARRERQEAGARLEKWRLPLLTDVLLAHLAKLAGFAHTEIWDARVLRPRNVRGGASRESLVVAYKRRPARR